MMIVIRILIFLVACFFILPLFNVEDPFRSLGLRFLSSETQGFLYEHQCEGERLYRYEYKVGDKTYQQLYNGYNEKVDNRIPENIRCSGSLSAKTELPVRYFIGFPLWSEPVEAERLNLVMFIMVNTVKIIAILLLIWMFVRR